MNDKDYLRQDLIVRRIVNKKKYLQDIMPLDDLVSECWLEVLKKGYTVDDALLVKIVKDKLNEIYRKYKHRLEEVSIEHLEENSHYIIPDKKDSLKDIEINLTLDSLLKRYKVGSKERKYLEFYYTMSGIKDFGIRFDNTTTHDGFTKTNLAKFLGFSGTSDRGFIALQKKMKNEIRDYLCVDY